MADHGVIFDMDGVLIDSYQAHFESWRRMLSDHGLEMTEKQFASTFGQTNRSIIAKLYPDHADDETIARWGEEKEQAFRELLREDFPEMPGAGDLLRDIHRAGMAIAVGSSGPAENVEAVLQCLDSGELVSVRVTGSDVTHGKPNPEVFLKAAEKLDLEPSRCAVVEDAPAGVEAARRARMAAIALTGTAPREKLAERAHRVVDSLGQISADDIRGLIEQNRP